MLTQFDSLPDLFRAFRTEQACIDHLRAIRWRNGEFCPHCGHDKIYEFSNKRTFKCAQCRQKFSIKVGTIFADTKLPLRTWFGAIWMITNHPKGIASTTLAKDLHVTQKTAWFVLHRLRHAARVKSFDKPLTGTVEIDETFVGGKARSLHGRRKGKGGGAVGMTPVIGAAQRKGGVVALVVPLGIGRPEAQDFIDSAVSPEADMLVTDAHRAYASLEGFPQHQTINHAKGEHRRGQAHTNTIESVWAQLKRQIVGVHHWVSPKHLQNYVNEMAWRMSRRDLTVTNRMNALFAHVEGRLTYKALIG
jgi:transposase-like protein